VRHVLLVLHALVEAHLPHPVALEKYPMQEQRLVCKMEQLSALLERTSIQSQHPPSLIAQIVLQAMFALADQLHLHPAQRVSI